jgi:putative ABC transport system substrate-binding protein
MVRMKRREFLSMVGCLAAWPTAARAQSRVHRIGVLFAAYAETDPAGQSRVTAFRRELEALGWREDQARIEYRWGGGSTNNARALALVLVQSSPDVIVVAGDPALTQLQSLSTTIPIVFTQVSEPVDSGFVSSLARPGGYITGFQNFEPAMGGKWLGVLKELAPHIKRVGALFGSDVAPHASFLAAAKAAAPSLGVEVAIVNVQDKARIEPAIVAFADQSDSGLLVFPHPNTIANRALINALTACHQLPAIYPYRYFATEGGLVSYGPDQIDQWRGAARYVDRILKGERPANLPVQAPTKFELVINLKTAKALDLAIPPAVLARADEVIE